MAGSPEWLLSKVGGIQTSLAESNDNVNLSDPRAWKGKLVGVVVGDEEAESNSGTVYTRPYVSYICSVERIRKGLDEDRRVMIDANGRNKSGSRFVCEVAISSIDMADPDDLVFTVRNIERRRRILEQLRAKEGAFDVAQSALFTCDPDGRFTSANKAFRDMFDLATDDDLNKATFQELMSDPPLPEHFKKALEGKTTTTDIIAESDGEKKSQDIEIVLAPNMLGKKIRGVVGSVIKI